MTGVGARHPAEIVVLATVFRAGWMRWPMFRYIMPAPRERIEAGAVVLARGQKTHDPYNDSADPVHRCMI